MILACTIINSAGPLVASAIGGGISATLGFYFAQRTEKNRRKAAARSALFSLRDTFDPQGDVQKFHADSIPIIRDAIAELTPFVRRKSAAALHGAWQAYRSVPSQKLHTDFTNYIAAATVRFNKAMGRPCATAEEIVLAMLDHLEAAINDT
jgi:hypothetical protein